MTPRVPIVPFWTGFAAFCTAAFVVGITLAIPHVPDALPLNVPEPVFSAARAMTHLRIIAGAPHPAGSPRNQIVRAHIINAIQRMGLPAHVQTVVSSRSYLPGVVFGSHIANVVTRLEGAGRGRGPAQDRNDAVLFVCHYDSVPNGFGAGDNGAACAAFLEAIRAWRASAHPTARNDLIFLFSDAEETGLAGAQGFADAHPWMKDVRVVVDFEGRGNSGPSALFETGRGSGAFVRAYAGAVKIRRGNSLSAAAYDLLPNDTDFTVYQRLGLPGLNFAFFQGVPHYHTLLDNVDNISLRSIQHHGDNVMGAATALSSLDLKKSTGDDAGVYFDLGGHAFVQYSKRTAWVLGAFAVLAFVAFFMRQFKDGALNVRGALFGAVWGLGAIIASASAAWLFLKVLSLRDDSPGHFLFGEPYNGVHYILFLAALPGIVVWVALKLGERFRLDYTAMASGGLLMTVMFLAASLMWLPGASYLIQWPFIFGTLAYGAVFAARGRGRSLLVVTSSLPILFLGADSFPDFFHGLTVKMGAAVSVPMTVYWLCLIPLVELIRRSTGTLLRNSLLAVALAAVVNLVRTGGYDAAHPRQNAVMYFHNSDTRESHYATCDEKTDAWTSTIFPTAAQRSVPRDFFPIINSCVLGEQGFLMIPAPAIPQNHPDRALVLPPTALNLRRAKNGDDNVLSFVVRPNPEAAATMMFLKGSDRKRPVWTNGHRVDQVQVSQLKKAHEFIVRALNLDTWAMMRQSAPGAQIQVEWSIKDGPLELILVDVIHRMPRILGAPVRPAGTIPAPSFFPSDSTYVAKSYRL